MAQKTLIIGLTGRRRSGKTTVSKYLVEKHHAGHYRFSFILENILGDLGVEATRKNLENLGANLQKRLEDPHCLARALAKRVMDENPAIAVVDGLRTMADYEILDTFGKRFFLIGLEADLRTRWMRAREGSEKFGERGVGWIEFQIGEAHENERDVDLLVAKADHLICTESRTKHRLFTEVELALRAARQQANR